MPDTIPLAIIGRSLFAAIIVIKAHSPSEDEPTDQFSEPFGDMPFVIHSDGGDFMGWVRDHGDASK
jgi:hypothetical protein